MAGIRIVAKARSNAAPSVVFELLNDGATWPYWSIFDSFKLERAGHLDPLGIGAIRVFRTKVTCSREEVELIPGEGQGIYCFPASRFEIIEPTWISNKQTRAVRYRLSIKTGDGKSFWFMENPSQCKSGRPAPSYREREFGEVCQCAPNELFVEANGSEISHPAEDTL